MARRKQSGGRGGLINMMSGFGGGEAERAAANTKINPEYQKYMDANGGNVPPITSGIQPYADGRGWWGKFTGQPTMANQMNLGFQSQGITNSQNLDFETNLARQQAEINKKAAIEQHEATAGIDTREWGNRANITRESAVRQATEIAPITTAQAIAQQKGINEVNAPYQQQLADIQTKAKGDEQYNTMFGNTYGFMPWQATAAQRVNYMNMADSRMGRMQQDVNTAREVAVENEQKAKTGAMQERLNQQLLTEPTGIESYRQNWFAKQALPVAQVNDMSRITAAPGTITGYPAVSPYPGLKTPDLRAFSGIRGQTDNITQEVDDFGNVKSTKNNPFPPSSFNINPTAKDSKSGVSFPVVPKDPMAPTITNPAPAPMAPTLQQPIAQPSIRPTKLPGIYVDEATGELINQERLQRILNSRRGY